MLKAIKAFFADIDASDRGANPDESLWSPSGWSYAATGVPDSQRYRAPVEVAVPFVDAMNESHTHDDRKVA